MSESSGQMLDGRAVQRRQIGNPGCIGRGRCDVHIKDAGAASVSLIRPPGAKCAMSLP